MITRSFVPLALSVAIAVASCGGSDDDSGDETDTTLDSLADSIVDSVVEPAESSSAPAEQMFPDVLDATAERSGATWTISATLSSPYDSPSRYADAWRVIGPDGTVYGERILGHDHAGEQPFTRTQSGIEIPDDVEEVTIEGRDLEFGYGGTVFQLSLPR